MAAPTGRWGKWMAAGGHPWDAMGCHQIMGILKILLTKMTKMTKLKGSVGQNQRISQCTIQWSVGIPC